MWSQVDFEEMVKNVRESLISSQDLTIVGGECQEEDLFHFLREWDIEIPYRFWEYVSEVNLEEDTLPEDIVLLERGRLFGSDGDLLMYRNRSRFHWRFIGKREIKDSIKENGVSVVYPEGNLYQYERSALLWGSFKGDRWEDERVAGADLNYPIKKERVILKYKAFLSFGQVRFVWYTGFGPYKGG